MDLRPFGHLPPSPQMKGEQMRSPLIYRLHFEVVNSLKSAISCKNLWWQKAFHEETPDHLSFAVAVGNSYNPTAFLLLPSLCSLSHKEPQLRGHRPAQPTSACTVRSHHAHQAKRMGMAHAALQPLHYLLLQNCVHRWLNKWHPQWCFISSLWSLLRLRGTLEHSVTMALLACSWNEEVTAEDEVCQLKLLALNCNTARCLVWSGPK